MNPHELATRGVPAALREEITRYGGQNPYGMPLWRVVLAENVREQCFGQMKHMPRVSADADLTDIEPEKFTSGEMWVPRYDSKGWILERWFPASAWGSQITWEHELAADGLTKLKGEWPRHGDYFMVGDESYAHMPGIEFWKEEIQKELRRQANAPTDPATYLFVCLYLNRVGEEMRRAAFMDEVNHIHRGTVEPMLATVGRTAQMMRNEMLEEMGINGHLSAG